MSTQSLRARLARLERAAAKATAKNSDLECDWNIDPAMAKAFWDDYGRANELSRKRYAPSAHGGPITTAEEEEESRLRANLDERARAVVCPSNYGGFQARRDDDRLS